MRGFDKFLTFQTDEMHYYNHTIEPRIGTITTIAPIDLLMGARCHGWSTARTQANYSTYMFTSRAAEYIHENGDSKPMFLYVAYQAVHVPHETPPSTLYNDADDGWKLSNVSDFKYRAKFGETLVALDNALPDLIDALRTEGMFDRTFLVVASDNGGCPSDGSNNYPLRGGKFDVFDGGVKVPSFVYSKLIPENLWGTTLNHMFHVSDWLPTLVNVASMDLATGKVSDDIVLPSDLDGVSQFASLMEGSTALEARQVTLIGLNKWTYNYTTGNLETMSFSATSGAVIIGDWKFIKTQSPREVYEPETHDAEICECGENNSSDTTDFLFKITEDPHEGSNLIDEYPSIAKRMLDTLHEYYLNASESSWESPQETRAIELWETIDFVVPWSQT